MPKWTPKRYSPYPTPRSPWSVAKRLFQSPAVRRVAYDAGKYAVNTMVGTKKGTKSAVVTTTQRDVSRQYRYKRMPRGKRRRWVSSLKKNAAMDMAESATQTVVYNNTITGSVDFLANGKTQNWMAVHLYGVNGSPTGAAEIGVEDMKAIRLTDSRLKNQKNTRVKFESGVLDLTIKNPNANNALEVDIYEVVYRSATKQSSIDAIHQNIFTTTVSNQTPPSAGDVAAWDRRGITPFDTVQFGANGAKILGKQKVFLPKGDTFTFQYRDPKNHYFGPDSYDDTTGFVRPGVTRTFLFIFKTVTGETISGTNPSMTIGITRIYKYKIKGEVENGIILG